MPRATRGAKIRGAQLAIVVDNKDGGENPGYRIKVKLPWLNDQESTFWARIAVPMAGAQRGTYVLPEIDDQVLVVFEHGDINRPIIIGAIWSNKHQPVETNQTGKNNTKLIKSRTGHRVVFDDKQGAEKISIVDKTKKNKIVFDSANKLFKIESDGEIEIIAKNNVIMHSNALKVGTSEAITGKGQSLLTHSQKTFSLKATSSITIGGGSTMINVMNSPACSVSGAGTGELGGVAEDQSKDQVQAKAGAAGGGGGGGGSGVSGDDGDDGMGTGTGGQSPGGGGGGGGDGGGGGGGSSSSDDIPPSSASSSSSSSSARRSDDSSYNSGPDTAPAGNRRATISASASITIGGGGGASGAYESKATTSASGSGGVSGAYEAKATTTSHAGGGLSGAYEAKAGARTHAGGGASGAY
ncbi:MAG TPA: phage baseplate assembly protein V, partial [Kofleriaceae bacterium]|nr:phage baseplate assembly protein V [Kofleriaceae bacterium]